VAKVAYYILLRKLFDYFFAYFLLFYCFLYISASREHYLLKIYGWASSREAASRQAKQQAYMQRRKAGPTHPRLPSEARDVLCEKKKKEKK